MSLTIDTLATATVARIKEWAVVNGLKYPSGLKKEQAIEYLKGQYVERQSSTSNTKTIIRSLDELQYRMADPSLDWLQHLHIHGWAVAPITGWDPNFTGKFFEWFESCNNNFNRHDPGTWLAKNMPVMLHGILKNYYGHTELQWQIRELCVPIFERIWN